MINITIKESAIIVADPAEYSLGDNRSKTINL